VRWYQLAYVGLLAAGLMVVVCYRSGEQPAGPIYLGKTARQWEAEVRERWICLGGGGGGYGDTPKWYWMRQPGRLASWLGKVGIHLEDSRETYDFPLLDGSPDAVPVLLELLKASDLTVRRAAIQGVAKAGASARAAFPALLEAMEDADDDIAQDAMCASFQVDREAAVRAGVERVGLTFSSRWHRQR
jgi:hypothetical protein